MERPDAASVDRSISAGTVLIVGSFAESLINFRGPLIRALLAAGWRVHACAPVADGATAGRLAAMGVRYHPLPLARAGMNPLADLAYLVRIRRLVRTVRPDVVMAYTMKPVIYAGLACKVTRTPFLPLVTGLGYAFVGRSRARRILRRIVVAQLRLAFSAAKVALFQNADDLQLFRARRIVRRHHEARIVAGSGIDLSEFRPVALARAPVFLMIARLLHDKGVREYARAAALVRETNPEAEFHLVGWIDENPASASSSELERWTRGGTIRFLGRLADVRPAIAASRVYVLPSYREGLPRTVVEAMAMGRPVITTDVPGCRETVVDGVNGLLVPARDANALADAMRRMLSGELDLEAMARASIAMAKEKFDADKVGAEMVEALGHAAQARA